MVDSDRELMAVGIISVFQTAAASQTGQQLLTSKLKTCQN
jgi:hypothetical protein